MKKAILFLALLLPASAMAQISYVGSCSGTTSCASVPSHTTGDLFVIGVARDLSTTAPTIPAGYTAVTSALTINGTSTADSYFRVYCKVAAGSSETVTGFTSASAITASIYRGNKPLVSTCADIFGTPVTSTTAINTTSTTVTYGSVTNGDSQGWDIGLAYTPAATAGLSTAPTGMSNRVTQGTVSAINDTNAAGASYSTANVTITTASRVLVATMEIKGAPLAAPTFNNGTGGYTDTVSVTPTLASSSKGCYTMDGTTPTATTPGTCLNGTTWNTGDAAIVITTTSTLKMIATKSGWTNSSATSATYTITLSAPSYSPVAGSYGSTQSVTISTVASGTTMCYTTNGATPAASAGTFTVAQSSASAFASTGSTVSVALPANPTTGHLIVVGMAWYNGTATVPTITSLKDANNNSYTIVNGDSSLVSTIGRPFIGYLLSAPANADKTLTATFSNAGTQMEIRILDIAVSAGTATLDTSGSGSGTSATVNLPSLSVLAGDFMYGELVTNGQPSTPQSPWTVGPAGGDNTYNFAVDEYLLSSSAGSVALNSTQTSTQWATAGAAFTSSAGCTTGSTYSSPVSIASTTTLQAMAFKTGTTNSSVTSGTYTISGGAVVRHRASVVSR